MGVKTLPCCNFVEGSNKNHPYIQIGNNYRPQQSWGKVMFLHLSVILFTGEGVCLSACWDTTPPWKHTPQKAPPPPGSTHHPREAHASPRKHTHTPGSRLRHTVNERPVRILLECILVIVMCVCVFVKFSINVISS